MEILGVRLDTRTTRGLEIISKVMKMSPSKWIAGLIAENLPKAIEEVKSERICSYVRGEISKEELREVFGDGAELAEVSLRRMLDILIEHGVKGNVKVNQQVKALEYAKSL